MKTVLNKDMHEHIPEMLPVIPTMDVVVFPHMIVPLLVLDEKIIKGINQSLQETKLVLLLAAKKQPDSEEGIATKDLYTVGTVASIMRLIKIPEGGIKILVQGICKAEAQNIMASEESLHAHIIKLENCSSDNKEQVQAHVKNIKLLAEKMAISGNAFSPDFHIILSKMQDPEKIADFILSHLNLVVDHAQALLETNDQAELLEVLYRHLAKEMEVADMQEKIRNNARDSMNKAQKEFYLREQMRAIKKELGEDDIEELEALREKLECLEAPEEVKVEVRRHLNRLEKTSPDSMEATVTRNYLEWIFSMPWNKSSTDNLDIENAKKVLDEDHYGLKEIKDRILDFISIRKLKTDGYPPILCFVGPPGIGKTSLGSSIARALGRGYARISLGGVKDEAEIRGHRRTYVGAMPGRFIQAIKKSGSCNPVLVIDELDKIGSDFRGDPSAAMLEVLDPQQNATFYDNYLGVPFDLSQVMFIATANSLETISEPLRDRMEIIDVSGYTHDEKLNIAKRYLVPRAVAASGLQEKDISICDEVITDIIVNYTKESGVRQLERLMKKLCSKAARILVETNTHITFTLDNLPQFLGPRKYTEDDLCHDDQIGISNGLAWTPCGGEMIQIEAVLMPGKGKLILTGQLGDVMKESAQAALSYSKAHASEFEISQKMFTNYDIHIHVPAGAVPKDGPSAGITMLTAILSVLTQRPINAQFAMTGELNLQGHVMPIGGVKEKILAAKRNKVDNVIIPHKNKQDLMGLEDMLEGVNVILVSNAGEVLQHVLMPRIGKVADIV
jgi:ATP-dependent Lon protease